jgi:hypothetical protein
MALTITRNGSYIEFNYSTGTEVKISIDEITKIVTQDDSSIIYHSGSDFPLIVDYKEVTGMPYSSASVMTAALLSMAETGSNVTINIATKTEKMVIVQGERPTTEWDQAGVNVDVTDYTSMTILVYGQVMDSTGVKIRPVTYTPGSVVMSLYQSGVLQEIPLESDSLGSAITIDVSSLHDVKCIIKAETVGTTAAYVNISCFLS